MSTDKKGKGAGLDLGNISLVKSKLSNKKVKEETKVDTESTLKPIHFKVDRYYRDRFYEYCNVYFASGTIEPYNKTTFFKVLIKAFIEQNIKSDEVQPITERDYLHYIRMGRRRRVEPFKCEFGGTKSSVYIHLKISFKKEIYSNLRHYYKVKENLKNGDLYSLAYFFRDVILWMVKDDNFNKYILKL